MDLYYYTTTETMKYILSGGNIFATNMKYMNDSEEYFNGLREVRDYLRYVKENRERYSVEQKMFMIEMSAAAASVLSEETYRKHQEDEVNSFSISFTTARDLLSQWSMYAKESGVSLKMEFKEEEYDFMAYNTEGTRGNNYCMSPQKVYYFTKEVLDEDEYEKIGNEILQKMQEQYEKKKMMGYEDNIKSLWLGIAPFVKRADFGAEEEYRLVFKFDTAKYFTPRVDFRIDESVIKPYLDISLRGGWPITEIIVGPGFNQDAVFNSIAYYLEHGKVLVPAMSAGEIYNRILDYLKGMSKWNIDANDISQTIDAWERDFIVFQNKNGRMGGNAVEILYRGFQEFVGNLGKNEVFRSYIQNNYFSPNGIVLTKSKIPYIF